MSTKPAHLTPENAAAFREPSVVAAYHLRLPYPPEVFAALASLATATPRAVLDVGTGTGELARPLAEWVDRVDALDISAAMVEKGRTMPGGDHPRLRWIVAPVETAELHPPYALVTAGDSLHWMDWDVIFPRFHDVLAPGGYVALISRTSDEPGMPWLDDLGALVRRYSTIQNFQPFDLVAELEQRNLFQLVGRRTIGPITVQQPVEDYIASFHSRASLARERMPPDDFAAFDGQLRELVAPWSAGGMLEVQTIARIEWGLPLGGH